MFVCRLVGAPRRLTLNIFWTVGRVWRKGLAEGSAGRVTLNKYKNPLLANITMCFQASSIKKDLV